jgi:hypothetical protein
LTLKPTVIANNWLTQPAYIENNVTEIKTKKEQIMFIEINTTKNLLCVKTIDGKTVINTKDYPELDDKTIEEMRSLDYETLFNLKTKDSNSTIKDTMSFFVDEELPPEYVDDFTIEVDEDGVVCDPDKEEILSNLDTVSIRCTTTVVV